MTIPQRTRKWVEKQLGRIPAIRQRKAIARGKRAVEMRVRLNVPKVREELIREFTRLYQIKHVSENASINRAIKLSAIILEKRRNGKETKKEEKEFDRLMEAIGRETTDNRMLQITRENAQLEQNYPDIMAKRIAMREIGITRNQKEIIEAIARLPARTMQNNKTEIRKIIGKRADRFIQIYEQTYRELTK